MSSTELVIGGSDDTIIKEFIREKITSDNLNKLANHYICDKGDTYSCAHNYVQHYEKYFHSIRHNPIKLLEIGVAQGSSLKMWASYFTNCQIDGIDINPLCKDVCKDFDNINIIISDAASYKSPESYDIIIDDGSHLASDITNSFNIFFPKMKSGSIYIIEDLYSCTNPEYIKHFFKFIYRHDNNLEKFVEQNLRHHIDNFFLKLQENNIKYEKYWNEKSTGEICFIHK